MVCIFLNKWFPEWWNWLIVNDLYFFELGIATEVELTQWFWMIPMFLNKLLPQWFDILTDFGWFVFFWIRDCRSGGIDSDFGWFVFFWIRDCRIGWMGSLILDDLCFLNKELPHWWNWLSDFGWCAFSLISDCRSGGIDSLILDDLSFS